MYMTCVWPTEPKDNTPSLVPFYCQTDKTDTCNKSLHWKRIPPAMEVAASPVCLPAEERE